MSPKKGWDPYVPHPGLPCWQGSRGKNISAAVLFPVLKLLDMKGNPALTWAIQNVGNVNYRRELTAKLAGPHPDEIDDDLFPEVVEGEEDPREQVAKLMEEVRAGLNSLYSPTSCFENEVKKTFG